MAGVRPVTFRALKPRRALIGLLLSACTAGVTPTTPATTAATNVQARTATYSPGPTPSAPPSLVPFVLPSPAPAVCPAAGTSSPPTPELLATRAGPVTTRVVRDPNWTRPALVPSIFLARVGPGTRAYEEIVCHDAYIYGYGNAEGSTMLQALTPAPRAAGLFAPGATWPSSPGVSLDYPTPGLGLQLWLMGLHFRSMRSDAIGHVAVEVERAPGFEWVVFDLEALAVSPHAPGALTFRFIGPDGVALERTITRTVRASWEYGRSEPPR